MSRDQPAAPIFIGTPTGLAPDNGDGAGEIRPGRGGDEHFVALARNHPHGDLRRRHAAGGHEKALGIGRFAVDPLVIAGDGLTQFRDAALVGVEGLAGRQGASRRVADEGRRRAGRPPRPRAGSGPRGWRP